MRLSTCGTRLQPVVPSCKAPFLAAGLVVYFDSYDNDGARDNPVVSAMVSDGKKLFDHETDGRYTR